MTLYRFVLPSVALAVCQFSAAQPISGAVNPSTSPAAVDSVAPPLTTTGMPAGVSSGSISREINAASAGVDASVAPFAATAEPRIIRGNDQVVAPGKATAQFSGPAVTFSFEEAPISEVVRTILGDILKVDYVLHPPLNGTITLTTRNPVTPDHAAFLLEAALQANGLALVRDARGSYHVGRPEALKSLGGNIRQVGNGPLQPGYGAIIVPLQYIGATEMATILRPMLPADALVRVDPLRNILVMMGSRSQAEGWLDMISTFDVSLLKGMSVGVFPLKYASLKEVEAALRLMGGGGAGTPAAGAPSAGISAVGNASTQAAAAGLSESNPIFGALRIMPIERLNSILVVTPRAANLDEARRWIERLDQPSSNTAEPQLFVYHVQNGSAKHLTNVLNGIFGDGKTSNAPAATTGNATSGVAPGLTSAIAGGTLGASGSSLLGNSGLMGSGSSGLGLRSTGVTSSAQGTNRAQSTAAAATTLGSVRVMADEVNNVILVWGLSPEYAKIETALKRLDVPPTQVLIEASIIEVTLDDSLQYGLQWSFSDKTRNGLTGSGALTPPSNILPTATSGGFSYTLTNALGNVRAVLTALAGKSLLKVISSPSIMVQDNFTANITVGTQQPVNAGSTISGTSNLITTNIQYKDTGVNLAVTPSVNAGNMVSMDIDQKVTDLGNLDNVTQQYAFLTREIASKVAVRSGESLVLGGLIRDNTTVGNSGIPFLKDIPVIGNAFGSTNRSTARTELLVIITPRVVRSDQELRDVSNEMRERMRGLVPIEAAESANKPKSIDAPASAFQPIR